MIQRKVVVGVLDHLGIVHGPEKECQDGARSGDQSKDAQRGNRTERGQ